MDTISIIKDTIKYIGGKMSMKKATAIALTISMLITVSMVIVIAGGSVMNASAVAPANTPLWVITEVSPDQKGDGTGDWSNNDDCMEFIEIYNNSGTVLNLYDFCLTYNGSGRTSSNFESSIVEITPIKPGNYLDGTTLPWSGKTKTCSDLSNMPVNPDTCLVQPGEVVVLWFLYYQVYYSDWNSGKGLSLDDFRSFWDVPTDVKVIAVDGNSDTGYGGHDKNFNLKNSGVGTYGLAYYSDELNTAANTVGSTYPVVYDRSTELVAWASVDYDRQPKITSNTNRTFNYTVDTYGYGASEWNYIDDARRMVLLEVDVDATPGRLTTLQKLTIGIPLDAAETFTLDSKIYTPDKPKGLGNFKGFIINDIDYVPGSTFTASEAGIYSFAYSYSTHGATPVGSDTAVVELDPNVSIPVTAIDTIGTYAPVATDAPSTTKPVTTTAPPVTTTTVTTTEKPEESTPAPTEAPGETLSPETTTAAPKDTEKTDEGGCGSVVAFGILASVLPAAVIVCSKKRAR